MPGLSFFEFWDKLIFRPKKFFSEDFRAGASPYFLFVLVIFGVAKAIDRMDSQFLKYDARGTLDQLDFVNNWPTYWGLAILLGLIGGYLFYLFGGWFYNLRVKWSNGTPNKETARFIYLYASFLPSLITVLITVSDILSGQPKPYVCDNEGSYVDLFIFLLLIFANYYSVYMSYQGVTTVMQPDKWKGRIWFLILPVIFYTLAYIGIITALIMSEI